MSSGRMNAAMDLMRRLPPQKTDLTLDHLISIAPDLGEEILCSIDQPLKVKRDSKAGRDYLLCDYNRDRDSYRSPWSNTYYPPLEDGVLPSEDLRKLENSLNSAFDQYREMYFEGGISSVYLWNMDQGFAGVILIKKTNEHESFSNAWDSIHVIDVFERPSAKTCRYKVTSTLMVSLQTYSDTAGYVNLGGSITRFLESDGPIGEPGIPTATAHVINIGRCVENIENSISGSLKEVYFGTSKNIVDSLHSLTPASEQEKRRRLIQEVNTALQNKSQP